MTRSLALTATLLACSWSFGQEPSFEALGQAPVVAGDRVRARERALDEALKQAVEQATATVLSPDQLVARAGELKLRIYPRARDWVATYRVLEEGETNGLFQVHLSAQVATGRLQRALASSTTVTPPPASKLRGLGCVSAQSAAKELADAVTQVPAAGGKLLRDLLMARNVEAIAAPGSCSDEAAAQSARAGAAQGALVGSVELSAAGSIRGTELNAAHARARVDLVEPDGRVSGSADAERDGYGAKLEAAAVEAARQALSDAAAKLSTALSARWSAAAPTGGVIVKVTGAARFAEFSAVVRALRDLPGVAAVEPRRFARGESEVLVRTASPASQLAQALNRGARGLKLTATPSGETALTIQVTGTVDERG
jgi:hypothetical protein